MYINKKIAIWIDIILNARQAFNNKPLHEPVVTRISQWRHVALLDHNEVMNNHAQLLP